MIRFCEPFIRGGDGWSFIGDSTVGEFRSVQIIPQSLIADVLGKKFCDVIAIKDAKANFLKSATVLKVEDGDFGQVLKLLRV